MTESVVFESDRVPESNSEIESKARKEMLKELKKSGVKLSKAANWAVHHRKRPFLKELLEMNVDVDKVNSKGHTPLGTAVMAGDRLTVEILIENGASVDLVTIMVLPRLIMRD